MRALLERLLKNYNEVNFGQKGVLLPEDKKLIDDTINEMAPNWVKHAHTPFSLVYIGYSSDCGPGIWASYNYQNGFTDLYYQSAGIADHVEVSELEVQYILLEVCLRRFKNSTSDDFDITSQEIVYKGKVVFKNGVFLT